MSDDQAKYRDAVRRLADESHSTWLEAYSKVLDNGSDQDVFEIAYTWILGRSRLRIIDCEYLLDYCERRGFGAVMMRKLRAAMEEREQYERELQKNRDQE